MQQQQLATFPVGFPTDILGKPTEKIANGDHMIMTSLATGHNCKQVAKHPD